MPTLKQKALKCAIADLKKQATPGAANIAFKRWEVFHDNQYFKQAVKDKRQKFNKS